MSEPLFKKEWIDRATLSNEEVEEFIRNAERVEYTENDKAIIAYRQKDGRVLIYDTKGLTS